uniref:Snake venom 5'-nucleotidase (Fragments) n=1 Tax=Gloydius blomhoffii blomhoffii TaxID=417378 RepID=V5NTD_GLOBB|nr:RecName: Full=Snake venom 5'-nucleotidase; Short=5'-NT; AltName: Full=Ecto-5'-nucleotidase [Gloydius blomhoffii blomhoffii]
SFELTILHTNDVHARVEIINVGSEKSDDGRQVPVVQAYAFGIQLHNYSSQEIGK